MKQNFIENNGSKKNKKFYSFIKAERSGIMGIFPILHSESVIYVNDKKHSELLSDQLASVFSLDDGLTFEVQGPRGSTTVDITFAINGFVKLLRVLNSEKVSESDKISARVLKEYTNELDDGSVLLFSVSFMQGKIPEEWRHTIITPVYKDNKENRSKGESYRPISLTSVTCKLVERIIHSHIIKRLDKDQTLSETQHGFRKIRSRETQLLETINNISSSLNNNEQVDSILLVSSKAFDKVCHQKLLLKLDHYGIKG